MVIERQNYYKTEENKFQKKMQEIHEKMDSKEKHFTKKFSKNISSDRIVCYTCVFSKDCEFSQTRKSIFQIMETGVIIFCEKHKQKEKRKYERKEPAKPQKRRGRKKVHTTNRITLLERSKFNYHSPRKYSKSPIFVLIPTIISEKKAITTSELIAEIQKKTGKEYKRNSISEICNVLLKRKEIDKDFYYSNKLGRPKSIWKEVMKNNG